MSREHTRTKQDHNIKKEREINRHKRQRYKERRKSEYHNMIIDSKKERHLHIRKREIKKRQRRKENNKR